MDKAILTINTAASKSLFCLKFLIMSEYHPLDKYYTTHERVCK